MLFLFETLISILQVYIHFASNFSVFAQFLFIQKALDVFFIQLVA